jgi:AraC-like ligand binding domain
VAIRTDVLAVSVPGLRALRWWTDELYAAMKERYTIGRIESGRSSFWSSGKVWSGGAGSLQITQPGDVHRDVSRDGPITFQVVTFPADVVESVTGKVRVHSHLHARDARGAAFQRLHDAVHEGAERLALEVAITEAISAFATIGDAKCEQRASHAGRAAAPVLDADFARLLRRQFHWFGVRCRSPTRKRSDP